jgi:protoporphyrinogen/coproporphyrinogen III oxidase
MARVAVIGAGMAGLVAARELAKGHKVTLLEASSLPGGRLRTTTFRGRPLDLGPDAFIVRNAAALHLAEAVGLGDEVIHPASRSAAIFARGRLRAFPGSLAIGIPTRWGPLASSHVLSARGLARVALDLLPVFRLPDLSSAMTGGNDPSVSQVLGRHLGREVLDSLVDPLIGGINASDIATLSFAAALPQLVSALAGQRSVMRALRPLAAPRRAGDGPPVFAGLSRGMATLPEAIASELAAGGVAVQLDCPVEALVEEAGGWRIVHRLGEQRVDAVVLALPAPSAAALIGPADEQLARGLCAIPYSSVVTATFAFPETSVPRALSTSLAGAISSGERDVALPGSGVLIPRASGHLVTALSFTSTKWPRSAAPGEVVIRASAGRHLDPRALELDDEALISVVREEIAEVLGITGAPLDQVTCRYPDSFPQYVSGHGANLAALRSRTRGLPPIALVGAAYDGIGIPAVVAGASGEAAELSRRLAS